MSHKIDIEPGVQVATGGTIGLEEGWAKIQREGILRVQKMVTSSERAGVRAFTNKEYMDLYTTIYTMCIQKQPNCWTAQLYDRHEEAIAIYLDETVRPAILEKKGEYLLKELVRRWAHHKLIKQWMCDFFRYLNRFYVKRNNKKPLEEISILRFRSNIYERVKQKVVAAVLELIRKDRDGEQIDRDLLRDTIAIFVEMGMGTNKVYQTDFEIAFIEHSAAYYNRQAASWLNADSCPEYLRKAEARILQEKRRISEYLNTSSDEPLMTTLYESLLIRHQSELLDKENTGLKVMLRTHAEADLARMFILYSPVPSSLPSIAATLKQYILEVGHALLEKTTAARTTATEYIPELMTLHDRYYDLVSGACFRGHATFHRALKDAFELIVNKKVVALSGGAAPAAPAAAATAAAGTDSKSKPPQVAAASSAAAATSAGAAAAGASTTLHTAELLANFTDALLNKTGNRMDEKKVELTLNNVVRLFSYLTDKDMFSEFYRTLLSKRLLLGRSASTDAEKSMISKLKLKCGAQFTSKLEGMLNDMRNASDHNNAFKDFVRDKKLDSGLSGIDFSVQVLTTGFWPTQIARTDDVKIPPVMQKCTDVFKQFYDSHTNNRILTWLHNLGVVTITGFFTKRKTDLVVTAIQAAILLQFNDVADISIEELTKVSGLTPDNLKSQLRTLVSGKYKILAKKPVEGYKPDHRLSVNMNFTDAQFRVRIPAPAAGAGGAAMSEKEREKNTETVEEDRRHAVEACIVRIMKSRKTIEHQQLMLEVSAQLMQFFKPDPKQIKKRIEDLIAREYLERDAEKSAVYHYIA